MLNKVFKFLSVQIIFFFPTIVFAVGELSKTRELLSKFTGIISKLIPLVFALAVLAFFWGVVKYIWSTGSGKEAGRKIMLWGVLAIFVISSVWGLVKFMNNTLGIDSIKPGKTPSISL